MPEFQKKQLRFVHNGIDWTRALDVLADGRYFWVRNGRSYREGEIVGRPGFSQFIQLNNAFTWIHTITRMAAQTNLPYVYVLGADTSIFVGQNTTHMQNGAINPVNTLAQQTSGLPLTLAEAVPVGGGLPWTYIGDTAIDLKVGYYPGQTIGVVKANCLPIGLPPPILTTVPTAGGAGNLNGNYQWIFVQRNRFTGVRSNPSAASRATQSTPALSLSNQTAIFTSIPNAFDFSGDHVIDIYRFGGTVFTWRLVASNIAGGSAFTDNIPDSNLLAAPQPSQFIDQFGNSRFNLFQPWITQVPTITGGSAGAVTQQANGTWRIGRGLFDPAFDLNWLPGSTIVINGFAFTIYQVIGAGIIELTEDLTLLGAGTYAWSVPVGTLRSGQPQPSIWGPWGLGESASFIFACGDGTGNLYWSNGNDPDSMDVANSLLVTSAAEPLVAGCVFDARNLLWSTERMFEVFPSLSLPGQFYVQEIPGSRGLWGPYSLAIQSNLGNDLSVSWISRDGPYDFSNAGGLRYLGKDLGEYVPHDNQAAAPVPLSSLGLGLTDLPPPDFTTTSPTQPPSPNNIRYMRMCWFEGYLFWDYRLTGSASYACLVWDKKLNGGDGAWVSVDTILAGPVSFQPIVRRLELSGTNYPYPNSGLICGVGNTVYAYTGGTDSGVAIPTEVIPGMQTGGDFRSLKFWGDAMIDANTDTVNVIFPQIVGDYPNSGFTYGIQPVPGIAPASINTTKRIPTAISLNTRAGTLARSLGIYLLWSNSNPNTAIYGWEVTYVDKPSALSGRPTDVTDDGYTGRKRLRAVAIEGNDLGAPRLFDVFVDGAQANTSPLLFSTGTVQTELSFGVPPTVGFLFQLRIDAADTSAFGWEIDAPFSIRWVWEKWPERDSRSSPVLAPNGNLAALLRGFTMPIDTTGAPVTFTVTVDGVVYPNPFTFNTDSLGKTAVTFAFTPLVAHEVQIAPGSVVAAWYDEISWMADPWPEFSVVDSPWIQVGQIAAFVQGLVIPVCTDGTTVTQIQLKYTETGASNVVPFGPLQTPVATKEAIPFSFGTPFIAHEVQLVPLQAIRAWWDEIRWIAEPVPEIATVWQTQQTDHDLPGYHSVREAWIAYIGSADAPVLSIVTPAGTISYTLPVSNGAYTRAYVSLQASKAPWRQYQISSTGGVRLFRKDCVVMVKGWGETGAYHPMTPFGDESRAAGARI